MPSFGTFLLECIRWYKVFSVFTVAYSLQEIWKSQPIIKNVGIPLGILPHVWEQNKRSYFPRPGQS